MTYNVSSGTLSLYTTTITWLDAIGFLLVLEHLRRFQADLPYSNFSFVDLCLNSELFCGLNCFQHILSYHEEVMCKHD